MCERGGKGVSFTKTECYYLSPSFMSINVSRVIFQSNMGWNFLNLLRRNGMGVHLPSWHLPGKFHNFSTGNHLFGVEHLISLSLSLPNIWRRYVST